MLGFYCILLPDALIFPLFELWIQLQQCTCPCFSFVYIVAHVLLLLHYNVKYDIVHLLER